MIPSPASALIVPTGAGRVEGVAHPGGAAFYGIPFAEAPVGALRFLAPQPARAWEGIRSAARPGATPQRRPFGDVSTIPEPSIPGDATLNVNVFTPAPGDARAGLPVLVWIHGGGFFAGSPSSPWYDGRSFSRDGVVTVAVSYRLGFDGFGWVGGAPGNRGILDQIAALEWVQRNIASFGGDPGRVTIAGQSAGGGSVLALLASPRARGLFSGAIIESGPTVGIDAGANEAASRRMAAALGIEPDLAGWRSVSEDRVLDHERAFNDLPTAPGFTAPADELIAALRDPARTAMGFAWSPVADGDVLPSPLDALRDGRASGVPVLLGSTRDEFAYPAPVPLDGLLRDLRRAGVSEVGIDDFLADLRATGEDHARSRLATAQLFRGPALQIAAARRDGGAAGNTWLYDFAWRSPVTRAAAHCYEIPFAWDLLDAAGVDAQFGTGAPQSLADRMHADWVGFIASGSAPWPTIEADAGGAMRYEETPGYATGSYAFEDALLSGGAAAR